jgi:hypothetical protein
MKRATVFTRKMYVKPADKIKYATYLIVTAGIQSASAAARLSGKTRLNQFNKRREDGEDSMLL